MGKSTLAQRIKHDLQALVLENDAIKLQLLHRNSTLTRDEQSVLTWQYSMDLYARLSTLTPNGLVVRDGVIDWYYDRILPVFLQQGYKLFVVAFDVSKEKRIALIRQRGDKRTIPVERFMQLMVDHDIHVARFRAAYQPDVTLNDSNLFEYDTVIAQLRVRLQQLAE